MEQTGSLQREGFWGPGEKGEGITKRKKTCRQSQDHGDYQRTGRVEGVGEGKEGIKDDGR